LAIIPDKTPRTTDAIYEALAATNDGWDSLAFSVGSLGHECRRALWFDLRWASEVEVVDGRKVSIFRTGDAWEERIVADLDRAGFPVYDQQRRIRFLGGQIRGKIDGRVDGLVEAPGVRHTCEFKSSKAADYRAVVEHGIQTQKPLHYSQIQMGMHSTGDGWGAYFIVNKDTDERHLERIEYDREFCERLIDRAEGLLAEHEPPSRIRDDAKSPPCLFCRHKGLCFVADFPRVNCRTCLHSTPHTHGDNEKPPEWSCDRWTKPLSIDEQRAGCPTHLYLPGIVPGDQISVDEEAETILYELYDGRKWTDGLTLPVDI